MSPDRSLQVLWVDGDHVFCRQEREGANGDRHAVLALLPAAEHQTPASLHRLTHEYALKDDLDEAWAVRPLELVRELGRTILLLKDPGGEPLDLLLDAPMDLKGCLSLAIGIAVALGKLHQQGLVHKDIKPANIVVGCADGQVRLTGFGLTSRLPRERQVPEPPEVIVGTLAYMAPEQTGRMNRSVDSRSDLYSLGVTFYQMFTGTLPFTASDPMEWIHCHIARKPVPPDERLTVPAAVSAIIMKLLAKTGEERYQTAIGVEKDLRHCLAELERKGRIDPFSLAGYDAPDRLLIPEKLYGRGREVEALLASFDSVVSSGRSELVLVSGYSGIGKSSVVHELYRALVPPRGLFAAGKFDQYKRGIPYATLAQAFQDLVRQLLGKGDSELRRWRDALMEALGPNGQLMVNLIPELALIIGEQPPLPELSPQDAQSRFQIVFRRFLGVFARPEHPLALFVDDLQWLDAATLELLADLLVHADVENLLLVGAYRDNEVGPDHPLVEALATVRKAGMQIHEIQLGALSSEHVGELVADALRARPDHIRPLVELVFERTGGNPFFAIHFITELVEEGLLAFDAGTTSWTWDLLRIHGKGFTDNVADLMAAKLGRLPRATQEVLEDMACLGNVTRAATLAMVREATEADIRSALWPAILADLVVLQEGDCRFLHDRIHEAAYARMPEAKRPATHLRIGRLLVARTAPEALEGSIFEIVNQFVRGGELIDSVGERQEVAALDLMAGRRAKAGTAYVEALRYLSAGRDLLPVDAWERSYRLIFDLELNLAECEFLTGDFAPAEKRLAALSTRALGHVDLAAATRLFVDLRVTMGDMDGAVQVGLDYLRQVDPEWPLEVTADEARREYDRLSERLNLSPVERLLDLPAMTDPDQRAKMDVLAALQAPALYASEGLRQQMVCRMVAICLEHGNSDGAPVAYVLLGSIQGMFFGDYQGGARLAKVGLDLVERPGFERFRARVYSMFAVHVSNWSQPLDVARTYLRRAFEAAQESGDVSFAAFSCIDLITNLLAAGTPLSEVEREARKSREIVKRMRFGVIRRGISEQLTVIRMLRGAMSAARPFSDAVLESDEHEDMDSGASGTSPEVPDQLHRSAPAICAIRELQARSFMADFGGGLAAVIRNPPLWAVPTQFERAEYHFHAALAQASLGNAASAAERAQHLEALAAHHRQLQIWAEHCPENFENRAALVGAEIAGLEGRALDAERLYEQAIRSARANGFVHNAAIAYECASAFYRARGFDEFAETYLRNARAHYARWGADGKVRQLDQLHPHLGTEGRVPGPTDTIGTPVEHLDLATVLKVSQAISGEIVFEKLIDTLLRTAIEQAGAERGLLVLSRGAALRIAAEAKTIGNTAIVHLREEPATAVTLPESILHYVVRTRESVILDDASDGNSFSMDPYIREHQARSILCLPLLNQAKLIGVLYLENNLAPHVFAPARIPVLKLLASQAAISLENSRLYRDLAEREAKIRQLVDSNIIGIFIFDVEGRIFDANDAFLRMVGYDRGDFVAGHVLWTDLTPPDWRGRHAWATAELKRTGTVQPYERECFRKDGSRMPALIGSVAFDEQRDQGVAFVLDMTERKRAEERLRVQHTVAQILAEAATIEEATPRILRAIGESLRWDVGVLWRLDREAEALRCVELWHESSIDVPEFERVSREFTFGPGLGLPGRVWSSLAPVYISDVVSDENFPRAPIAKREGLHAAFGFPILIGGDVLGAIEFFSREIRQPDQELLNMLATIGSQIGQFIERKRAEAELRESEQNYRTLFESIDEGFCTIEVLFDQNEKPVDYRFLQVSPSFERQTGIKNAAGKRMREIAPRHEENWFEIYGRIALTGEPTRFENEAKQLGRWYDVYAFRVEDPKLRRVGILFNDITKRKRAEAEARDSEYRYREVQAQLARASRVATMGQLTASIAHEIRQPIAAAVTNAQAGLRFLGAQPPDLEEVRQVLGSIVSDGMRASDIIGRIRALIKNTPPRKEGLELNEAVLEVIALTRAEVLKNDVSVRTQLADGLPLIRADRVQLQQVILNLIINAVEAMSGVGEGARELLISTGRDASNGVLVSLRDSGPGLDPKSLDRLLEAFYTTKAQGMGLGLAISQSIIKSHGGRLWASANEPRGAVFQFTLPADQGEATSAEQAHEMPML